MAAQMYYILLFKLPLHSLTTFGRTAVQLPTNSRARTSPRVTGIPAHIILTFKLWGYSRRCRLREIMSKVLSRALTSVSTNHVVSIGLYNPAVFAPSWKNLMPMLLRYSRGDYMITGYGVHIINIWSYTDPTRTQLMLVEAERCCVRRNERWGQSGRDAMLGPPASCSGWGNVLLICTRFASWCVIDIRCGMLKWSHRLSFMVLRVSNICPESAGNIVSRANSAHCITRDTKQPLCAVTVWI